MLNYPYKSSPTFEYTMPMFILFDNGISVTTDFYRSCLESKTLTLNVDYLNVCKNINSIPQSFETPFKEIKIVSPYPYFKDEYKHMFDNDVQEYDKTFDECVDIVVKQIEEDILRWWNPNRLHVMFHSAGNDSRMVSAMINKIRETEGNDWLGEIKFVCAKPEQKEFVSIMKHLNYKPEQYVLLNKEHNSNVGYRHYDLETKDNLSEACAFASFYTVETNLLNAAYLRENWKNIDYIGATLFNYLFSYPIPDVNPDYVYCKNNKLNGYLDKYYARTASKWVTTLYNRCNDYLLIGNGYKQLENAIKTPNKYKVTIDNNKLTDKMRYAISEKISKHIMQIPLFEYVNNIWRTTSEDEITYLDNLYFKSKFYSDLSEKFNFVKDAKPGLSDNTHMHNFSQAMLPLAMLYDKLIESNKKIDV